MSLFVLVGEKKKEVDRYDTTTTNKSTNLQPRHL